MCKNYGCCGSLIRLVLGIINVIFLLIGLAVFIIAGILRWSPDSILNKLSDNQAVESIINLSALNYITIALLAIGGFIIFLSVIGLLGILCSSKFFLVIYEVVIVILFLAHGITLIVCAFKASDIEKEFRIALNNTIHDLNDPQTSEEQASAECAALKLISEIFQCCGASGPGDFKNETYITECCVDAEKIGCADKTVNDIKDNGVNIIIIPNVVILAFELLIIIMVPFLIGKSFCFE